VKREKGATDMRRSLLLELEAQHGRAQLALDDGWQMLVMMPFRMSGRLRRAGEILTVEEARNMRKANYDALAGRGFIRVIPPPTREVAA
jgi:hypothetical protein